MAPVAKNWLLVSFAGSYDISKEYGIALPVSPNTVPPEVSKVPENVRLTVVPIADVTKTDVIWEKLAEVI